MIIIEPKKKSPVDLIINIVVVFFIFYLLLQLAPSFDDAKTTPLIIGNSTYINWKIVFSNLKDRLSNQTFNILFSESTFKFTLLASFFSLLFIAYVTFSKKKFIRGKEYGSAEWGKSDAIKHLVNKEYSKNMLLTESEKISIVNYELNNNTLVIGGSGSGKTRGVVMPNLLQAHSSFVITDPKGEVLRKSGKFFKDNGYDVCCLNLFEMNKSSYYNPFVYLNPDKEEEVMTLINTIMENTDGDKKANSSDPFWEKSEQLFLQSIFYYILFELPPEEQNIPMVLELIRMAEIKENDDEYQSDLDILMQILDEQSNGEHIAVVQYKHFKVSAGKTAKSIIISASARLAPFNIRALKNISSHDTMNLRSVGEKKTALFIVVPPTDRTYNFVAGMLYTQLFSELNYIANAKYDGSLPIPVRFILDEFATTCSIPNFVQILAYARSLNIGIMPIVQSLSQLKKMYKDEWEVIIDNCDTLLYLGKVKNMDSLKYVSELLGKGTFDKDSHSRTRGRQSSTSTNVDKIGRALLEPDEISKMKKNRCLLFVSGYSPFYSFKFKYKEHINYQFTSDANKKNTYTYIPPTIKVNIHKDNKVLDKNINENIEIIVGNDVYEKLEKNLNRTEFVPNEDLDVDEGDNWNFDIQDDAITKELLEKEKISSEIINNIINEIYLISDATVINKLEKDINRTEFVPNEDLDVDEGDNWNFNIQDDVDDVLNMALSLSSEIMVENA